MDSDMDKQIAQLEAILVQELAEHDQLLELIQRKRRALRQANHRLVADCCRQENGRVQKIAELEKARLRSVGQLTLLLAPGAAEPLRLGALAQRLSEPVRGRLLVLRQHLRQRIEQVRHDAGIAQRAAETLARHMQGLVQTLSGVMGGGAAYGRAGAPTRAALTLSTFNVTA